MGKIKSLRVKKGYLLALRLILLLSLVLIFFGNPVVASPDEVRWSRVNIPTEGISGNWVLAGGSDVKYLTMAIDGSFYCYANPSGTSDTLYKSTDGGCSWSSGGKVKDKIVDIAAAPDSAATIYYATSSHIYKSTDAGNSFTSLPPKPGGAGSNNIEITSIDVTKSGSNYLIAIGTRDTDSSQFGGVYLLDEKEPAFGWLDTNIGSYDVYAVAFSPNFAADQQLVAVATNETNTIVTIKIPSAGWGKTLSDATIAGSNIVGADIAFPDNYGASREGFILFVATDTGSDNGDVYIVYGVPAPGSPLVTDLNIGFLYGSSNVDVTTIAVSGNTRAAKLLAGAANSAQVYFSTDGGINWKRSSKPPTGGSKTYVLMAPDFVSSGKAYAATSGTESAFSFTLDGGIAWNQIGLIDTKVSNIIDLAPSRDYRQNNNLFMLTWGGKHSLWRSLNGGTRWERIFTSALANVDNIDRVELSPNYFNSQVIFIAGSSNSNPAIWKSIDNGQTFSLPQFAYDPDTSATTAIDTWVVVNDNTLFIGSYDGSNGLVYGTTNSGLSYSAGAVAGKQSLKSIALSPNYEKDKTILVGNTSGRVYRSKDNGVSFEPLPMDATSPPLTGNITVAFDPQFSRNNTVYAASDTANKGIYRFIVGTSTTWESIDSTLPSGSMITKLVTSADGILYATNSKAGGGMERCLVPTYSLGATFETVTAGLEDSVVLSGLWQCGNQLWSIDTANKRLMTFGDSLTLSVTLTSPPNQAAGVGIISNNTINNVSLDWQTLGGVTSYKWQLDYDTDFSSVPTGFEGDTNASSVRLPALGSATIYYWRVRATKPMLSPWSAKWSFTTSLGSVVSAVQLYSPEAGASQVPLKPIFQWSPIAGADSYELLVSTDISFANPIITRIGAYALPTTAWQCDVSLNHDTTYYWRVRASGSNSYSAWSAVGAFITKSLPEVAPPSSSSEPSSSSSPPPPPQLPPPMPAQPATPDWVIWLMCLGGALLLTMLAVLITVIILVIKVFRL